MALLLSRRARSSPSFGRTSICLRGRPQTCRLCRKVIEHHLAVRPNACPVKQKVRRQAAEKQDFVIQEVEKLQDACVICEVICLEWVANPMVVAKPHGGKRMCVDFTNLNKAFPKDHFPLSRIDQIMDSTVGCDLLCFLDAFSGYHQIKMAREDEEKTAFIIPCRVFCYLCMAFGLKSAGPSRGWWPSVWGARWGEMQRHT